MSAKNEDKGGANGRANPNANPNPEKQAGPTISAALQAKLAAEIEIEFGDARNRVMLWGPTQEKLRGHWLRANLNGDELVEPFVKMPDMPGQRVVLNYGRRVAVIYDPLGLKENADAAARISAIIYEHYRVKSGPAGAVERKEMDADDLKTWLYGMSRAVEGKKAKVTKGSLPTLAEVETLPGRTRMEYFNNSYRACRFKEEFSQWLDKILSSAK